MDRFIIEGGIPLHGTINVSGAKNAVLPLLAATILASKPCRLRNVPRLRDVNTMLQVLDILGCTSSPLENGEVSIDPRGVNNFEAPYELVKTMRASFIVLGPLVARHGRARVSIPGGCSIGARQIDIHLKGLLEMGAQIEMENGYYEVRARRLKGAPIRLSFPSVGATENLMLAATLAEGRTVLSNAAREPEIVDLARILTSMGARIRGAGNDSIEIDGVDELGGADHPVIPDRIEAGTWAIAAAITGGELKIKNAGPSMFEPLVDLLTATGTDCKVDGEDLMVRGTGEIRAHDLVTAPYPGFPTDLQAPTCTYLSVAKGTSKVTEKIFENRFHHLPELNRMGAQSRVLSASEAVIDGVDELSGAQVMASDLRAGAALIVAGLRAKGKTEIHRVYHIERGYENVEKKLQAVGARITRVT